MYQNRAQYVSSTGFIGHVRGQFNREDQLSINVVATCVDTMNSRVTKNRTRAQFVTNGGDDITQTRARNLTRFCDGTFYSNDVYNQAPMVFQDAAIFGTGTWRVEGDEKTKEVSVKHVNNDDIFVFELDGISRRPKTIIQRSRDHRTTLAHEHPELAKKLMTVESTVDNWNRSTDDEIVQVIEIWRIESAGGSGDGRYVKVVSNIVLIDEPWQRQAPFVHFRWNTQPYGFFGTGIAFDIAGIQCCIDDHLQNIEDALYSFAMPIIWVPEGSDPTREINTTLSGRHINYAGNLRPQIEAPQNVVSVQDYDFVWKMKEEAHDRVGLSMMTTSGQVNKSLSSGRALMEARDQQSDRFIKAGNQWDDMYVELCRRIVQEAKRIYGDDDKVMVLGRNKAFDSIKWSDVDLPEDKFVMEAISASSLSRSMEGREQRVSDLAQGGLVSREEILDLMDDPDMLEATRLGSSDWNYAYAAINRLIRTKKMVFPTKNNNLQLCADVATKVYNDMGCDDDADEGLLELISQYIDGVTSQIAPPPVPPQQQAIPQAVPGQIPQLPGQG